MGFPTILMEISQEAKWAVQEMLGLEAGGLKVWRGLFGLG